MVKVENGEVVQVGLPKTGTLKDGRSVSNYHLLDVDMLKNEGWYHLLDDPPEYNPDTQYLKFIEYELVDDKAIKIYEVIEIPAPIPNEFEQYKNIVNTMLGVEE